MTENCASPSRVSRVAADVSDDECWTVLVAAIVVLLRDQRDARAAHCPEHVRLRAFVDETRTPSAGGDAR